LMSLGKPKAANAGLVLFFIGQAIGWWMALYGIIRIHRTLRTKPGGQTLPAAPFVADAAAARLPHTQTSALPPAHFSVTEGTTELLGSKPREAVPVTPRRGEQGDTSPFA
jgi:hypothetical protein